MMQMQNLILAVNFGQMPLSPVRGGPPEGPVPDPGGQPCLCLKKPQPCPHSGHPGPTLPLGQGVKRSTIVLEKN